VLENADLRDVVMVAHSYGGMVATGVAARCPDRHSGAGSSTIRGKVGSGCTSCTTPPLTTATAHNHPRGHSWSGCRDATRVPRPTGALAAGHDEVQVFAWPTDVIVRSWRRRC
jgi:pimeloyl-ACP methyl ester carboxylesterase